MNFHPLHDFVLVEALSTEARSGPGILLPDTAQVRPQHGRVLAAGKGRRVADTHVGPLVSVGDMVIYGALAGTDVVIEGKDCLILKEEEILGVVSDAKEIIVRDRRLPVAADTSCTLDHIHGLDCCDD